MACSNLPRSVFQLSIVPILLALASASVLRRPTTHVQRPIATSLCLDSQDPVIHTTSKQTCPCHFEYSYASQGEKRRHGARFLLMSEKNYQKYAASNFQDEPLYERIHKNGRINRVSARLEGKKSKTVQRSAILQFKKAGEYRVVVLGRKLKSKVRQGTPCSMKAELTFHSRTSSTSQKVIRQVTNQNNSGSKHSTRGAIIGASIGGGATLVFVFLLVTCALAHNKRRRKNHDFTQAPRARETEKKKEKNKKENEKRKKREAKEAAKEAKKEAEKETSSEDAS